MLSWQSPATRATCFGAEAQGHRDKVSTCHAKLAARHTQHQLVLSNSSYEAASQYTLPIASIRLCRIPVSLRLWLQGFAKAKRTDNMWCQTPCSMLRIAQEDMQDLLEQYPQLLETLTSLHSDRRAGRKG